MAMMKTTVALLLLVLIITQTPVGQLAKLPILIEHFCKHNKRDDVSVFQFLKDHYTREHNDGDRSEDEQLPFKTIITQGIGFALLPSAVRTDFSLNLNIPKKIVSQRFYFPRQYSHTIFHPPRTQK
jgi:hypothetical protein